MDIGTLTGQISIEDQLSSHFTTLIAKTKQFASNFNSTLGGLVVGTGAVAAGVGAVSAAIASLGNRGADINDLTATLDQFAGSSERAAEIVQKMRGGTMGVVSDFDLMKSSAKLLAGGVKLTADQFEVMSKAAFVLQNQGLGPTKEMLDLVSAAMLRGRTRSLEAAIGKIDAAKAEMAYAKALGTTRNDLTEAERLEAKRGAILEALTKKVKEAGEQQRDFGEILEYVVTQTKNWFDKLASAVAASPNVMRALDAIGDGFNRVFGGTSQNAIDTIVNGINTFADAVTTVVPYVAEFLRIVRVIVGVLWDYRNAIVAVAAAYVGYKGALVGLQLLHTALTIGVTGVTTALWSAVTAIGAFMTAAAPAVVIIGSLAAVGTVAWNAWKLHNEEASRAADVAKQQAQDAANLELMNRRLGTSYTNLADAVAHQRKIGQETATANAKAAEEAKNHAEEIQRKGRLAEAAAEAAAAKARAAAEEFAATVSKISGATALLGAQAVVKELNAAGGPLKVLPSQMEQMARRLREGAEAALLLGKSGLARDYEMLARTLSPVIQLQQRYSVTIGEYVTAAEDASGMVLEQNESLRDLETTYFGIIPSVQTITSVYVRFAEAVQSSTEAARRSKKEIAGEIFTGIVASVNAAADGFVRLAQVAGHGMGVVAEGVAIAAEALSDMRNVLDALAKGDKLGAVLAGVKLVGSAAASMWDSLTTSAGEKAVKEIGRNFGVAITEEMGNAIAETAKKMFGGDRFAASIFSLKDIIEAEGGINDSNIVKYTARLRDVFVMLETGAFSSAEAMKVLDENFDALVAGNTDSLGFWSSSLKEITRLNAEFGTQSKAIEAAIRSQVQNVLSSFNMIVAGSAKARQGYADIKKEVDDTTAEIKKLNEEPERGRGVEWAKKMEEAQARLTKALTAQHEAGKGASRELTDLGTVATAAFATAVAKGMSFQEALAAAQPGLVDLRKAYADLGMDIEDPFLKMLAIQSRVMEQQPELLQGVAGLGASLVSMSNLNMLNADTFAAMGRLAADSYTRIQEEVAAAGGSTKDALLPMQDYLHAAAKAAKDLNLPLDEHTQMMIQQSKDLGIWKEQGPTAAEAMQAATENLTQAIERLTAALTGIPTSLPDPFANWNIPTGGPGFDSGGVVGRDWKARSSRDVIPAWLRRGEVVVTPEQMATPTVRAPEPESRDERPMNVALYVDGKKMTDVVINRLGGRLALGGVR